MKNSKNKSRGRVTIPTDNDVIPETMELIEKWGADALRDCDGTEFPKDLADSEAKIYKTYYTTRKDNQWARANPDEIQQCYIMTAQIIATTNTLEIHLMNDLAGELLQVNDQDDIKRWWEVIDRTTGTVVSPNSWNYESEKGNVIITNAKPFHSYTISFLAYLIWDPVHMYNAVINDWTDVEHQMTFDVRQPKTKQFTMDRLKKFIEDNDHVDVLRFTTFFHQFTLVFDELKREKYVDWYGYSASVSPYVLEQFEREVGYKFRPEYIIDEGYYNNQYRIPTKEYLDFVRFQHHEVCQLAKEMVDITHESDKEAMMFLGDHFIGTEPYMDEFKTIGLDAVVGSVGNGSTLRLIADIEGVDYREGRLLPYFFPDTFHEGGDPLGEAKENWITARRAILRKPIDRIGYGGYLKLAYKFPEFVDYVAKVTEEFRELYDNIENAKPYCVKKVAVLNSWGKMRSWGCHMVHHGLYHKENYSYAGVIEALSGAPLDVDFISFDDLLSNEDILNDIDVIINVGDADTAHSGGSSWVNPRVNNIINSFVFNGGGFIGVGEPSGHQYQGKFIQLRDVLGIEKETGFTLGFDKYNWEVQSEHFILKDCVQPIDFGEGKKQIYALGNTQILHQVDKEVQMAVNEFGDGRGVYISGLPYSFANSRVLLRSVLWSCKSEDELKKWYSDNYLVDIHAYQESQKYCVVNNTYDFQTTRIHTDEGKITNIELTPNEIKWFKM